MNAMSRRDFGTWLTAFMERSWPALLGKILGQVGLLRRSPFLALRFVGADQSRLRADLS